MFLTFREEEVSFSISKALVYKGSSNLHKVLTREDERALNIWGEEDSKKDLLRPVKERDRWKIRSNAAFKRAIPGT